MPNSLIFGGHFENMQMRSLRRHFSACQHWFLDSAYQITPNQGIKPLFFTKCLYLLTFLIFFPDYTRAKEIQQVNPGGPDKQQKHQAPTISSIEKSLSWNYHRV